MATTILGQNNTDSSTNNRTIYWIIAAAAVALILIFAFAANRNDRAGTAMPDRTDRTVDSMPAANLDSNSMNRNSESSPAMDSAPTNPGMASPSADDRLGPSDTGVRDSNGLITRPPATTDSSKQVPGTSQSPEAPKGTVERK